MKVIQFILAIIIAVNCYSQQTTYLYDKANRLTKTESVNQKQIFYYYDQNGNRIKKLLTTPVICLGATAFFHAGTIDSSNTYQWQVDDGNGFVNILDNTNYIGTNTHTLTLNNPPTSWYGYKFRCAISGTLGQSFSNTEILKFQAIWNGIVSNAWEDPTNWSCNQLPDENTDVIVNNGTPFSPLVTSNASVRTLTLGSNANWDLTSGYNFTIMH